MSWPYPNSDTTCRGDGSVITAVKLRVCQQLRQKVSARWCLDVADSSHVGQLRLDVQPRPHGIDRFSSRKNEIDASLGVTAAHRIALGLCVPNRFHLEQSPVPPADVVFSKLERRAPPGPFEIAAVYLLEDGTVPALATNTGSLEHVSIMNHHPCGSSVPTRCELQPNIWGQTRFSCVHAVGTAARPG